MGQGHASEEIRVQLIIPVECAAGLVFDDAGLEEVFLFLQIHNFTHPWEGVVGRWILLRQTDLY